MVKNTVSQEKKKPGKIKEDSQLWKQRRRNLLEVYAPYIVSCSNCGSPRVEQYVCIYCQKE